MKQYRLIKEYPGGPKLGTIVTKSNNKTSSYYKKDGFGSYTIGFIEDYPEHWEEIVEYPVGTRVYNSETDTIYTRKEDGWYKPMDKTAFTDKLIYSREYINVMSEEDLEYIDHKKQPLFTTEDGVDIYEGDRCYAQDKKDLLTKELILGKWIGDCCDIVYFSTKEAGEEYILRNKPVLSLEDVFEIYPEFKLRDFRIPTKHAEKLINVASEKLK